MRQIDDSGIVRFTGPWRGRVSNHKDPKKQGRIRVICPDVMRKESNWCLPSLPANEFRVPEEGDQVFIMFEQGDPDRPVVCGFIPSAEDGNQPSSPTQLGKDDETTAYIFGKGGGAVIVRDLLGDTDDQVAFRSVLEPATSSLAEYPHVRGIRVGQNYIELDGTPGEERIQIYHQTGAYYEIGAGGQVTTKAAANKTEWIKGAQTEVTIGDELHVVEGASQVERKKQVTQRYGKGLDTEIGGSEVHRVDLNQREVVGGSRETNVGGLDRRTSGAVEDISLQNRNVGTTGNHSEIVGGAISKTVGNKDFFQGQKAAYELIAALGDINFEQKVPGNASFKSTNAEVGYNIAGQLVLNGTSDGLMSLLIELINLLLSAVTPTAAGPQPLSIVTSGQLATLLTRFQAINGE